VKELTEVLDDKSKELEDVVEAKGRELDTASKSKVDELAAAIAMHNKELEGLKQVQTEELEAEKNTSSNIILALQIEKTNFKVYVCEGCQQILGEYLCGALLCPFLNFFVVDTVGAGRRVPGHGECRAVSPRAWRVLGNESPSVATACIESPSVASARRRVPK
jgi:hypothetical protein